MLHWEQLHNAEVESLAKVHYRHHPLFDQIIRIWRRHPRADGQMLICELSDGRAGGIPEWMTDAAVCASLSSGEPLVDIEALLELRRFLDVQTESESKKSEK